MNIVVPSGPSGIDITCGRCQTSRDYDDFTQTPISGKLPDGNFQCPSCRYAFRIVRGKVLHVFGPPGDQFVVREKLLEPVSSTL